jgi:hypothetical protein
MSSQENPPATSTERYEELLTMYSSAARENTAMRDRLLAEMAAEGRWSIRKLGRLAGLSHVAVAKIVAR